MRRAFLLGLLLFASASCSRDAPPSTARSAGAPSAAGGAAESRAEFEAGKAAPGAIEGLVVIEGELPARVPINTAAEGGCGQDPSGPPLTETWVAERGRLANVFVWLAEPPPGAAEVPLASEPVILRQQGCVYRPHALGLRVGEKLSVTNEDRARHNVHALPRRNAEFNTTQDPGAPALELVFTEPEVAMAFVCDLHPWMKSWVGVFSHPWFAVTGADGGFAWKDLPPGDYQVHAWHEALGKLSATARVSAEAGARTCFTFRKKP